MEGGWCGARSAISAWSTRPDSAHPCPRLRHSECTAHSPSTSTSTASLPDIVRFCSLPRVSAPGEHLNEKKKIKKFASARHCADDLETVCKVQKKKKRRQYCYRLVRTFDLRQLYPGISPGPVGLLPQNGCCTLFRHPIRNQSGRTREALVQIDRDLSQSEIWP